MSWTEDRVNLLKKLWGEGRTAAEIANELGGVTRNAVIGKAHRLKLSGRVSPIQQNAKKAAAKTTANAAVQKATKTAANDKKTAAPAVPKTANANNNALAPSAAKVTPIDPEKLVSLMDLGPRQCRWPSGDPREKNFGFCGCPVVPGFPYCEEHVKAAYQTSSRPAITAPVEDGPASDEETKEDTALVG